MSGSTPRLCDSHPSARATHEVLMPGTTEPLGFCDHCFAKHKPKLEAIAGVMIVDISPPRKVPAQP